MRYSIAVIATALAISTSWPLDAQVAPGDRVRVSSVRYQLQQQTGQVLSTTGDTISLEVKWIVTENLRPIPTTDTLPLALRELDHIEVSRESGHRTGRGALIGFGAGAALGIVIGLVTYQECVPQGWFDCMFAPTSAEENALQGGAALGVLGTLVGTIAGAMTRYDKWEEVTPPRAKLSVRSLPQSRLGIGLAISIR